ncbi:MAG: hypothetical protein R2827_08610 [Bdellovibrionales bacterium]
MSKSKVNVKSVLKYLLLYVSGILLFSLWLFPLNDLGDMLSSRISQATKNQVFVLFENLDLTFLPSPGVSVENLTVEGKGLPKLEAQAASFSPSFVDLLAFKPGGSLNVDGLFGSHLSTSFTIDPPDEKGVTAHEFSFEWEGLRLKIWRRCPPSPCRYKGD